MCHFSYHSKAEFSMNDYHSIIEILMIQNLSFFVLQPMMKIMHLAQVFRVSVFPQTELARWGSYFCCIEFVWSARISRRRPLAQTCLDLPRLAQTCLDLPSPAASGWSARISRRRPLAQTCLDLPRLAQPSCQWLVCQDFPSPPTCLDLPPCSAKQTCARIRSYPTTYYLFGVHAQVSFL